MAQMLRRELIYRRHLSVEAIDLFRELLTGTDLRLMPADGSREARLAAFIRGMDWAVAIAKPDLPSRRRSPTNSEAVAALLAHEFLRERVRREFQLGSQLAAEGWVSSLDAWIDWSDEPRRSPTWIATLQHIGMRLALSERARLEEASRLSGIPLLTLVVQLFDREAARRGRRPSTAVIDARRRMVAGFVESLAAKGRLRPEELDAALDVGFRDISNELARRTGPRRGSLKPEQVADRFLTQVDAQKAPQAVVAPAPVAAPRSRRNSITMRSGWEAGLMVFALVLPPDLILLKLALLFGPALFLLSGIVRYSKNESEELKEAKKRGVDAVRELPIDLLPFPTSREKHAIWELKDRLKVDQLIRIVWSSRALGVHDRRLLSPGKRDLRCAE